MRGSLFMSEKDLSGFGERYVGTLTYDLNFHLVFVDGTTTVGSAVAHMTVYALISLITLLLFVFSAATFVHLSATIIYYVTVEITNMTPQRR